MSITSTHSPVNTLPKIPVWQPWVVCFAAALYFFFEFMQVNMFNALTRPLFQTFSIDSVTMSRIWFCYNLANVMFLLAAGIILDRVSTRRLIIIAMVVSVLCTFGIALSTAIWQIGVLRFFTGMASTFCLLSCVRLASRWFPPQRMALVMGLVVTFCMLGGMMAQTPFTLMVEHFGWRTTVMLDASLGVLMLIVIALVVKDYPPGDEQRIAAQQHELHDLGFWHALGRVMRNTQNWLGGIYTSLMNLPIFILGALWGSLYLIQIRHLSPEQASYVTSMIFIGSIVGSPAMGWVSDRMRQRRLPMIVGAVISLVVILGLMYVPQLSLPGLMVVFFALGFITSAQIISYPLIAESNPANLTGTAEGLGATLIMGGGFMTVVFAMAMNWNWNHTVINNIPVYSLADFRLGLAIMPIGFVLALIAAVLIKETHCHAFRPEDEIQFKGK